MEKLVKRAWPVLLISIFQGLLWLMFCLKPLSWKSDSSECIFYCGLFLLCPFGFMASNNFIKGLAKVVYGSFFPIGSFWLSLLLLRIPADTDLYPAFLIPLSMISAPFVMGFCAIEIYLSYVWLKETYKSICHEETMTRNSFRGLLWSVRIWFGLQLLFFVKCAMDAEDIPYFYLSIIVILLTCIIFIGSNVKIIRMIARMTLSIYAILSAACLGAVSLIVPGGDDYTHVAGLTVAYLQTFAAISWLVFIFSHRRGRFALKERLQSQRTSVTHV